MSESLLQSAIAAAEVGGTILRRNFRAGNLEVREKSPSDFVTRVDRESEVAVVAELRRRHPDHAILAEEGGFTAGSAPDAEYQWVLDPLDGTTNFLQGVPMFAVSIACLQRRPQGWRVVVGVVLDPLGPNLFAARRGGGATWNGAPMRVAERQVPSGGESGLTDAFLATGFPFRARAAIRPHLDVLGEILEQARDLRRCGSAALDLAYTAAGVFDGFFELRLSPWDIAAGSLLVEEAGGRVSDFDGGGEFLRSGNVLAATPVVYAPLQKLVSRFLSEAEVDRLVPLRAGLEVVAGEA
jgi:myo-inositol-1(or 4)-monophosphatase